MRKLLLAAAALLLLTAGPAWATATTLTAQGYTRSGYDHTTNGSAADTSGGNRWVNTGVESLIVTAAGAPSTVTISFGVNATLDGATPANKTVVVGANKTVVIGTFPPSLYNDANSYVNVTFSAAATVSVVKPN